MKTVTLPETDKPAIPKRAKVLTSLWEILQDGRIHSVAELTPCLWDAGENPLYNIRMQISLLRPFIVPKGYDVLAKRVEGQPCYVLVKYLVPQPQLYL